MEKVYIQIRRGEGGKDSSLLVEDMADMYIKAAKMNSLTYEIMKQAEGMVVL